jgi:SAM-dependent methyltransferase
MGRSRAALGKVEDGARSAVTTIPTAREAVPTLLQDARVSSEFYQGWQLAELLAVSGRKRVASQLLRRASAFPKRGDKCLEVGCGELGWLSDLIGWGLLEADLCGIDVDPVRVARVCAALPAADVRVGDATRLPWDANQFPLVVASTLFTSVLDDSARRRIGREIVRVLAPSGALLWYDMAVQSRNPLVRRVSRAELRALFPTLDGEIRSVTLAPPIARRVVPHSWTVATILESLPFLRTHLVAVLRKPR